MYTRMKPIVTDTYDFPTLVGERYVYVDKMALLRRIVCVGVNYDAQKRNVDTRNDIEDSLELANKLGVKLANNITI